MMKHKHTICSLTHKSPVRCCSFHHVWSQQVWLSVL